MLSLWFARPTPRSIVLGAAIALAGLAVRAAAAGHLRKGETVAMSGPYAYTRNPLYLGSALLAAGFAAASRSWVVAVLVAAYYLAFYPFLMRREEAELRAGYGQMFEEYARRVPLFWPRLRPPSGAGGARFSVAQYGRNREYQAGIVVAAFLAALWALSIWRS
jgi:protein-S-isoprenylcysteine O-methyltransferase Ste14